MRRKLLAVLLGCVTAISIGVAAKVPRRARAVTIIAYGDTRFTDDVNSSASNPLARRILVAHVADLKPDAILISGDLPWHGGTVTDYAVFHSETEIWRKRSIRLIPALGNHEFSGCLPDECLENWWTAFPEFRGRRWHAEDVGTTVRTFSLDSMSPLVPGSEQRIWLEHELAALPPTVQFVLISLHHPPVGDVQTRIHIDHNPRPNEIALAEYLGQAASTIKARFVVVAGHVHNYERFLVNDVVYIVTGGGGAAPVDVDRTPPDLYQRTEFPNFHCVVMTIDGGVLKGEMFRLDEPDAPKPHFTLKDTFELRAR